MTRRELLALPLSAGAATLHAAKPIGRDRLSAITDEIARTPAEAIAFARQYGIRWLELRRKPDARVEYARLPEAGLQAAAREFAGAGLKISFLNSSILKYALPGTKLANPKANPDSSRFEKRMEELRHAIRAAHILGTAKLRVFTFHRVEEPDKLLPRIADVLGEMARVAEREKILLLVENEAACNVATCAEMTALMKMLPSRWIGINWDPLNATRQQEVPFPDGYAMLPKKRIGNVQIKGRSILPGPQRLDWLSIFRALEKDGYPGQVGLETHIFGDGQIQASHDSMREILRLMEPS